MRNAQCAGKLMMRMEMKNTSVESQLHTLDLGDRQQRRKVWRALISQCHCSASHCPARPDTRALCYQTTTTSDLDLYTALPRLTPACHAPHASRCPPWPHDMTGRAAVLVLVLVLAGGAVACSSGPASCSPGPPRVCGRGHGRAVHQAMELFVAASSHMYACWTCVKYTPKPPDEQDLEGLTGSGNKHKHSGLACCHSPCAPAPHRTAPPPRHLRFGRATTWCGQSDGVKGIKWHGSA